MDSHKKTCEALSQGTTFGNSGNGISQTPADIDETCMQLVQPATIKYLHWPSAPSYGVTRTSWHRIHQNVYDDLYHAVNKKQVFATWIDEEEIQGIYTQVYNQIINHKSLPKTVHHILRENYIIAVKDAWDVNTLIMKVIHFWILTSYILIYEQDLDIDPSFSSWARDESANILTYLPLIDSIVAKFLYHLLEKQQVAEQYQIAYVSRLVYESSMWSISEFEQLPFEADYAACFESKYIRDEEPPPDAGTTKVRYLIELFCTMFVFLGFRFCAFCAGMFSLLDSGYDIRRARESYLATVAEYTAWRKDNTLLDNTAINGISDVEIGANILGFSSMLDSRAKRMMASYDRQGMVLYCTRDTNVERVATTHWRRYYGSVSSQFHLIGPPLKSVLRRMASIKYTSGGGRVSASALSMVMVWSYIFGVGILSILAGALNWANRDNLLERLSDCIWIVTTLLISVFGLIKLTSEDPHAIRHALSGKKALLNPRQIYEYLNIPMHDEHIPWREALKGVVAAYPNRIEWLSSHETCYCNVKPIGDIRLSGGLEVNMLPGFIGLRAKGGILNIVLHKYRRTEPQIGTEWLHVKEEVDSLEIDPSLSNKKLGGFPSSYCPDTIIPL